jgi:hypothetical protein
LQREGEGRLRRPAVAAKRLSLASIAVALSVGGGACESTQQESARLERQAKRTTPARDGLRIARPSRLVKVLAATVVRDSEGAAVAVTVHNDSGTALRGVPVAIAVHAADGRTVFENDSPGLEAALVSVPSLPAHATLTWVDDQAPVDGEPSKVAAKVGEAPAVSALPQIAISGLHAIDDPDNGPGAAGTVRNRSRVAQTDLVVFVVARRGGRVLAAARAVLPSLPAGASASFQAFLVGDPRGARLEASAPAGTLG